MTLQEFFQENPEVAVAFSGGVDSAYLLDMAMKYAKRVQAYYVKTAFQPAFEWEDAKRMAEEIGAPLKVIEFSILDQPRVAENPADRCYYCKHALFSGLLQAASEDGFPVILDGTNASDEVSDRPGMRALKEMGVRSPLRECGLTKPRIRKESEKNGLFTWNKPAYACLATRIPQGMRITPELLAKVEASEAELFDMGYSDFRVRVLSGALKLQFTEKWLSRAFEQRDEIVRRLSGDGWAVLLDLKPREEGL
jgi:uncharacterized protein